MRNEPNLSDSDQYQYDYDYDTPQYSYQQRQQRQQRREPSDVSVEALDLADYAMTLKPHRNNQNYQRYPEDLYPPSQPPLRSLSRDSSQPPSLTSRADTLSSNTHSSRRPFSLPPQPSRSHRATSPLSGSRYPNLADPRFSSPQIHQPSDHDPEIDISQFPPWSRNWYNNQPENVLNSLPDIYTSLPKSHFDPKRSPFDPGNTLKHGSYPQLDSYSPEPYVPTTSYGHESDRDMLPWSNDPPEYGPFIDETLKQERMRMLEREFGPHAKSKTRIGKESDFLDEDGKPLIGTVNAQGQLVTQGPKKRIATRAMQIILAVAAAVPSIYAAVVSYMSTIISFHKTNQINVHRR